MTKAEFDEAFEDQLRRQGGRLYSLGHVAGLWDDDEVGAPIVSIIDPETCRQLNTFKK